MGWLLATIAGAVDAAGFVVAQSYTSHVSGLASAAGTDLARHAPWLALACASAILAFVLGAAGCTLIVRLVRARRLVAPFAWPLLGESLVLVAASMAPSTSLAASALCFAMGWQNAFANKVSREDLRTTHVTGIVTDIGIGLGRLLAPAPTAADQERVLHARRLGLLAGLLLAFLAGAVAGTFLAVRAGQAAFLLPAAALAAVGGLALHTEGRAWVKQARMRRRLGAS